MSQRQAKYKTTAAFPEPEYTQTPNKFFDTLPDMFDSEIRVTLVMIRKTFGFHRDGFKMGVGKLADAAGLSRQGALDGAQAAEKRGTFRRTNPDTITEAEWELVVALHSVDTPSSQLIPTLQPVEGSPQVGRGQVGVKERLKKDSKEIEIDTADAEIFTALENLTGGLSSEAPRFVDTWKEKHPIERIMEAIAMAKTKGRKPVQYVDSILIGWEANGYPKSREEQIKERRANGSGKAKQDHFEPQPVLSPAELERVREYARRELMGGA